MCLCVIVYVTELYYSTPTERGDEHTSFTTRTYPSTVLIKMSIREGGIND